MKLRACKRCKQVDMAVLWDSAHSRYMLTCWCGAKFGPFDGYTIDEAHAKWNKSNTPKKPRAARRETKR